MFCDSDDYVAKDWCKLLLENYKENNLILCDYYNVIDNEVKEFDYERPKVDSVISKANFFKLKLYGINVPWNKIYSLEIIKNNNIRFDESISLGEDLRFNIKYLDAISGNINFIKERLYFYTLSRENCLTNRIYKDYDIQCLAQFNFIKGYISKFGAEDKEIWNIFFNDIFWQFVNALNMNLKLKELNFFKIIKRNSQIMRSEEYQICSKNASISSNKICRWLYKRKNYIGVYIFNSIIKLKNIRI